MYIEKVKFENRLDLTTQNNGDFSTRIICDPSFKSKPLRTKNSWLVLNVKRRN